MRLWMSAEMQDDVAVKYRHARHAIEAKVNQRLHGHTFDGPWVEWAFIAIIMRKADAYKEVSKRNRTTSVLEFRLQIDRLEFKKATQAEANQMVVKALLRSLNLMRTKKYAGEADVTFLESALREVGREV